jgi:membrane protease YdiL (CAAX protease family)
MTSSENDFPGEPWKIRDGEVLPGPRNAGQLSADPANPVAEDHAHEHPAEHQPAPAEDQFIEDQVSADSAPELPLPECLLPPLLDPERPASAIHDPETSAIPDAGQSPLLAHYERPHLPAPQRIPNFGHLLIFTALAVAGYLCSGLVVLGALHFHLFGLTTLKQAATEIHYTLGSQAAWYIVTLGLCGVIFPLLWQRSFLQGLDWRPEAAIRLRVRLFAAAMVCFFLAVVDGILIPGPTDTPIDEIFRIPGAAWLLFAFGVTLAPLFEEIAYRGFLLPTLCTAFDWTAEHLTHQPPPFLGSVREPVTSSSFDADLNAGPDFYEAPYPAAHTEPYLVWTAWRAPRRDWLARLRLPAGTGDSARWSVPAMVVGSVLTSVPFALMHGEQTGYSLGPFVLLMCVSLVLCAVRLTTRSLAASVLVHSCYNLLLFSLMLLGTGGFRHLDRM